MTRLNLLGLDTVVSVFVHSSGECLCVLVKMWKLLVAVSIAMCGGHAACACAPVVELSCHS